MKIHLPFRIFSLMAAIAVSLTSIPKASGDVIAPSSGEFSGIYKITSGNDPIFPTRAGRDWFLDFGSGFGSGKMSGSVAVSLRENPNVKVRILAWQYFSDQQSLVLGNPFSENSTNAVAKGIWKMRFVTDSVILERGKSRIILHRADPNDY